jgi:hypothetical protein
VSDAKEVEQRYQKQRRHNYHNTNLKQGQQKGEAAEILATLSSIDDLPTNPEQDPVMGQLISKLTSTANLTPEEVRSNEWVREYLLILYLSKFPSFEGMHGSWRGWSHDNDAKEIEPMDAEKRMEWESFVTSSKLALSRSRDAKVIEEGTRNVNESIVNEEGNDSGGGGGILGRIRS